MSSNFTVNRICEHCGNTFVAKTTVTRFCSKICNNRNHIKSWETTERPREKLMEQGREAMSDTELLAMLICAGLPGVTAVDLAERVLALAGHDLKQLAALKPEDLMTVRGIGHARALSVISAMELAVRLAVREQPLHFLKLVHS
ncbi:MAG: hypothetical protein JO080_04140 [Mucilaginibacter sp.]|nr:hypothetical protein [Mucilaginibacter sp.]